MYVYVCVWGARGGKGRLEMTVRPKGDNYDSRRLRSTVV